MKVVCLHCLTLADPICKCTNVGTIVDVDGSLNIYVEDIRTCRLANVSYDVYGAEASRDLLEAFDTQIYVDYTPLKATNINYQPYVPKNYYVRQTPDTYDRKLMAVLDRYKTTTAAVKRIGSTRAQPHKRITNDK